MKRLLLAAVGAFTLATSAHTVDLSTIDRVIADKQHELPQQISADVEWVGFRPEGSVVFSTFRTHDPDMIASLGRDRASLVRAFQEVTCGYMHRIIDAGLDVQSVVEDTQGHILFSTRVGRDTCHQ